VVGATIKFAVGKYLVPIDDGHIVRSPVHLFFEEFMNAAIAGVVRVSLVPLDQ
jgi:hypothetical protein